MDLVFLKFKRDAYNITEYYKKLIYKTKQNYNIGSINEWIVDNYYVISEQEKYIKSEYISKNVKKIRRGRRVELYKYIYNYLKKNDFNLDLSDLFSNLNNYQAGRKDYFSYVEIDFIYLLIRLALINEMGELTRKLDKKLKIKGNVEKMFEKINDNIQQKKTFKLKDYIKITDDCLKDPYYIEQINYRLKELGRLSEPTFIKLNELLLKNQISLKDLIKESHDEKVKENVLMINLFTSFKKIIKFKLEFIYKNISYAEKALMNEKMGIYNQLYDNNKFDYRNRIIKGAKKRKISEYEYANEVVKLANKEKKHIGWYLFPKINYDLRAKIYIGTIIILTLLISYFIACYYGFLFFPILLIPISVLVMEVLSQILRHFGSPKSLFKLKFEDGLPEEFSTMVVIPTIANSREKVINMFETLEVYYLSNKTDNIYFTLLGDCTGEKVKDIPKDKEIREAGIKKVQELNEKYGKRIFNFVYRNRFYNEGEGSYLGFERKRGALIHFNKLLLKKLTKNQKEEYFNCQTFDDFNVSIKYVITLDTDTKLVLNTALSLIGAMAHPMNRPVLSKDGRKVVEGYGIMQPRISIDVETTNKSQYSQLFAGLGGLDIYTTACFDLYQDIFNEGSFVGKGIYDLEIFDQILGDAFPNNLILSHDLIEGNYIRCGFVNDVELFDDYPSRYLNDASRHHRWNRGDWQISGWLFKKVKNVRGEVVTNPIHSLGKWKIFDNLRRSLVNFFLLLIIFYGFTIGRGDASYYLMLVFIIIATPIFFFLLSKIIYRNKYDLFLKYYLKIIIGMSAVINKAFIVLAILPYEAHLYLDSIAKSMYRMHISKKRLLNWITAEEVEKTLKNDLKTYIRAFRINYFTAVALIILTLIFKPVSFFIALVIGFIWVGAPFLLYMISKDTPGYKKSLDKKQINEIRSLAKKTWKFFEDLLIEENNYLIPDNYQFNREKKTDYKTSPSNIGYSLISIVSAVELKFISAKKAISLLEHIIKNVESLNKWNGHLYNWYNIHTKKELYPYFISSVDNGNFIATLYVVKGFLKKHEERHLLFRVEKLIEEMDFSKLYNYELDVFSIGYNGSEQTLLTYNYNNFASESRLTSFIAIAKGDAPYKHWFCLDKTLTKYKHYKGVASWSGTAFEYFMPLIFTKTYRHTLLDETYFFAYYANREFIRNISFSLPWGMSESAYNELDDSENYKYSAFGIPYLKLQDSPTYPIVISPYSSMMAIGIDDKEVYHNYLKFKKMNMLGEYGLYESFDYEDQAIVKSFYAHHQGMILGSLTNYLEDNIIQEYFHDDKEIQAIEMLLKEKVQIRPYIDLKIARYKKHQYIKEQHENDVREFTKPNPISELGLLSNGTYSILMNDLGNSLSKYKNLQVNRARQVPEEDYGIYLFIRNLKTDKLWSNTYAPIYKEPDKQKIIMASDRIKYVREDEGIVTNTEITVTKDHNAEIRRITFKNTTNNDVHLELTSYGEIIMSRNEEDIAHRAFNSITIHTEVDKKSSSLVFRRKSLTKENTKYYIVHRFFLDKDNGYPFEYETLRDNFIGRNRSIRNPIILEEKNPLSKMVGASLDPIMSIRKHIRLKPRTKAEVYLLVGFGKSKEQIREIVNTYRDKYTINKAFAMTTVFSNMLSSYANLTARQMRLYNTLLKYIYQPLPLTKERSKVLEANELAQTGLWKFDIPGDLPIILVEIKKIEDAGFVKEVLQAYEFYKSRGLYLDVVIINSETAKKVKHVDNYIKNLLYRINNLNYFENSPGGVYTISSKKLSETDRILLKTVARLDLDASKYKSLEEHLVDFDQELTLEKEDKIYQPLNSFPVKLPKEMEFYNGYGGFTNDGQEYIIDKTETPTPWSNILANKNFGTVITNNLGGYTYAYNSREFKISTWSNDIIGDPTSEKIIINNQLFKPSLVRHGFGYSIFYAETNDYKIDLKVFVGLVDTIKFYRLKITNKLKRKQRMNCSLIIKPVLGPSEELTYRYLKTNFNEKRNCLEIKNVYNEVFNKVVVFLSATEKIKDYEEERFNEQKINLTLNIEKLETKEFSFMLGSEKEEAVLKKFNNLKTIDKEFKAVKDYWQDKLGTFKVKTPDLAFNYVINGWYLYQTLAARLIAKTGLYQVGGALGFRDQLQDVLGVVHVDSSLAREQIIKHAHHQFKDGSVLHWWHEELNFGVRTNFSDDYLWLVYVTSEYLMATEDYSILEEVIPFIEGEDLLEGENEKGITYSSSSDQVSLYEHLKLSVNRSLERFGRHDLPLMGCGDWNDGMNKVGEKGKGESVFVGFFLYDILKRMMVISKERNDQEFIDLCLSRRKSLKETLNKNAWDGAWYLRAFFDNGIPLGSRNNRECQIDLLSQSWSVLSEVASGNRKDQVFREVENRLVDRENKIIKLLTPPFRKTRNNPGYIKDYIRGTRENGGQYTHAALWYILALLKDKQVDLAHEYYQMINPINRSLLTGDAIKYKTEPYVLPADIYSNHHHIGRGGWTWYTGSASWAYKIGIEEILGFKKRGSKLMIEPKINSRWSNYEFNYRYLETEYLIKVYNEQHLTFGQVLIKLDQKELEEPVIELVNDRKKHEIIVNIKERL
ncbi:MAG: GH36-type glycosyl hydrolase domain-containing protein [Bacilli bacterium]|jgi:cyclic beta-1,2-glucan synthetase